jgi:hypothetical protein
MSAAAAQMSPSNLKTVADKPPAPTAETVLEQRASKEPELAALESRIGETAYAAALSGKSGAEALAALHARIQVAQFAIAASAAAHAHAIEADKGAVADWWQQVHALPADEAIEGITKKECCRRCDEHSGCLITGQECAHPLKAGWNLNPRHQGNPAVRRLHKAAAQKLGVYR